MTLPPLAFSEYEAHPPDAYAGDPIWRTRMFRMASYLSARSGSDVARLGSRVSLHLAQQFVRAIAFATANIAEGYSRGATHDRARFYAYALGSVREALTWIDALGDTPWPPRNEYRDLLVQIRRQLLIAIKAMRAEAEGKRKGAHQRAPIVNRHRPSQS